MKGAPFISPAVFNKESSCFLVVIFCLCQTAFFAHSQEVIGRKISSEGLEVWLEVPSSRFVSGSSILVSMVASNQLNVPRPFSQSKSKYHDTSIGHFEVFDSSSGISIESHVSSIERAMSLGGKGLFIDPHEVVKADGYLERTFKLTNIGKYLIVGKGRFRSTNWSGLPPGEWIELETPPVEIEILPSTNVVQTTASVLPAVVAPPAPTGGNRTGTHSPSGLRAPVAPAKEPPPIDSETAPSSIKARRNLAFAVFTLLPIIGLIAWIVWRRCRETD